MTKDERIKLHQAKIDKIIRENRAKQEVEYERAQFMKREGLDDLLKPVDFIDWKDGLGGERRFNLQIESMPLQAAAAQLTRLSRYPIFARGLAISRHVNLTAKNATVKELLKSLGDSNPDLVIYEMIHNSQLLYEIWDRRSFEQDIAYRTRALEETPTTTFTKTRIELLPR